MAETSRDELRRLTRTQYPVLAGLRKIYEIFFCLALSANVVIAVFDYTYLENVPYTHLTFRDLYLQLSKEERFSFLRHPAPNIDLFYDPIKGIEQHRAIRAYTRDVNALRTRLSNEQEVSAESLALMKALVERTDKMINKRPPMTDFSLAEKDGALELIKDRMRYHFMKPGEKLRNQSAKKAFAKFFSAQNLTPERRESEFAFFANEIQPVFEQNYFRWIDDDGRPKNFFSRRIDLWFLLLLFWPDFIVRWLAAIFTKRYRRWYLFPVRHWPDLLTLVSPHHNAWFRLLRIVSLYSRVNRNGWIPGGGIMPGIIHDNAAVIAEEISGMVLLNILTQVQTMMRSQPAGVGVIARSETMDEVQKLTDQQAAILASKMVPQIQPDIADLVEHSINQAMGPFLNSPIGAPMRLALMPVQDRVREGLRAALASPEGTEQMRAILTKSTRIVLEQLTAPENLGALQGQLARVIEELKQELTILIAEKG